MKAQFAIGFDFDHTLGTDNKLERAAFVRLVRHMSAADGHTVDEDCAADAIESEIAAYRAGRCSLEHAITHALEIVLGESMSQNSSVEAFRELAVSMVPEHVQSLPGVETLLRKLGALSIPHAILTNGWNPLQQCKADFIGFHGPVFVSDDLGVRKPDIHAFNVLRDYFALEPQKIWYVGDDPRIDVVGALGAGMNAIWLDCEQATYPADLPPPTATAHSIGDTLQVVR